MTKHTISDIGGEVVRKSDTYIVRDNIELTNLVLSSTLLYPGKSTNGHSHDGQEEVYIFVSGRGKMEIDAELFNVVADDVVTIPAGAFHRVYNESKNDLYFVCVFDGTRTQP